MRSKTFKVFNITVDNLLLMHMLLDNLQNRPDLYFEISVATLYLKLSNFASEIISLLT